MKTQEKDTTYAVLEDLIFDADEDPEEFELRKTSATTTDVAFKNMVASVKKRGVVQPIIIREIQVEDGSTRFQVIAGRRRCRAAVAGHRMPGAQQFTQDVTTDRTAAASYQNVHSLNLSFCCRVVSVSRHP